MIPSSFICSSDMRRGSEQLNPIHSFQITDDSAAFFCISINISFPKGNTVVYKAVPRGETDLEPFLPCPEDFPVLYIS